MAIEKSIKAEVQEVKSQLADGQPPAKPSGLTESKSQRELSDIREVERQVMAVRRDLSSSNSFVSELES